ncbi:DUF2924 domain-containing protein [Sulfitobacter sediminilitoris]|uniref:DUF2924 domain-containing protein n=1 Tax=Sulfitobacter sediminilitoris TaxID=2698830 RepID=UPI003616A816
MQGAGRATRDNASGAATDCEGEAVAKIAPAKLSAGAHLVRDWNGRTYQVHVTESGFEMDGKTWSSLSAIAKHITGATWSGPRFFGLNSKAKRA